MKRKTDKQHFLAMLGFAYIPHRELTWQEQERKLRQDVTAIEVKSGGIVKGQKGALSHWYFDADGNLVGVVHLKK